MKPLEVSVAKMIRFFDDSLSMESSEEFPATWTGLMQHLYKVLMAKEQHSLNAIAAITSQAVDISHHCYDAKLDCDLYLVIIRSYGQIGYVDRIPDPDETRMAPEYVFPKVAVGDGDKHFVVRKGDLQVSLKQDRATPRLTEEFLKDHFVAAASFIKAELEKVFGQGLIKECYHCEYGRGLKEADKPERLSKSKTKWKRAVAKDSKAVLPLLQWDTSDFIVIFNTGTAVRFTNSEWASFTKLNAATLEAHVK